MKLLLTAATSFELSGIIHNLDNQAIKTSFFEYNLNGIQVFPLSTGVGATLSAFSLARYPDIQTMDMIINVGVAGSFTPDLPPGSVVVVQRDRFADLGVEERTGEFTSVYELELENKDKFPLADGWIEVDIPAFITDMKVVDSITVNTASGSSETIERRKLQYGADIETMEGAGVFYAAKILDIPVLQLRSISNLIVPRDRESWEIETALTHLTDKTVSVLRDLSQNHLS